MLLGGRAEQLEALPRGRGRSRNQGSAWAGQGLLDEQEKGLQQFVE